MSGGRETILVVDDNEDLRCTVREVLEDQGFFVLEAPSGSTALETIARSQGPIHLVLTDVVMQGMSGFELAERLVSVRPEAKVLLVSGHRRAAVIPPCLRDECAFLEKPFDIETS
jgi:DNA-binding NtrC family response regulator